MRHGWMWWCAHRADRMSTESSELIRTLQSLAMGRKGTRVLVKRPPGKEVERTDKFAFNKAFTSDRIKFKINQIQQDLSVRVLRNSPQHTTRISFFLHDRPGHFVLC